MTRARASGAFVPVWITRYVSMRGEGAAVDIIVIDVVKAHASVIVLKIIRRCKDVIELQESHRIAAPEY